MLEAGEATGCWFDEPDPAGRRSWAIPPGHGTYQGLDLELLDPADENELTFLIEAQHAAGGPTLWAASRARRSSSSACGRRRCAASAVAR
jgi:hypothetical protein